MNLDIERIEISLQGVSADTGRRVAELLGGDLARWLSDLRFHTAGAQEIKADIGAVDVPAGIDARVLSDLIAARLVDWLGREHGASGSGRSAGGGR